jgi:hypothetical protein
VGRGEQHLLALGQDSEDQLKVTLKRQARANTGKTGGQRASSKPKENKVSGKPKDKPKYKAF